MESSKTYKLLPLWCIPSRRLREKLVQYGKSRFISSRGDRLLQERLQVETNSWVAKGAAYAIAKHRVRMLVLYQYAETRNLMVVGAANRTEWLTGTFSKWGIDHCADIMPLIHLYRTQLEQIAEQINVPEIIRKKPADPDILPGINDKGLLLGDFQSTDQILFGLEKGISKTELARNFGVNRVEYIYSLTQLSKHMRESPYQLT